MRTGLYNAKVSRIAASDVWVRLDLGGGRWSGDLRCRFLEGPGALTGAQSAGTAHTHPAIAAGALLKDQTVVVGFLYGDPDRPLVLGRLG